jgi:hypothetical protein
MKRSLIRYILFGLIGAIFGFVNSHYLFVSSALSLIPWAIVALIIGFTSLNIKESLSISGVYGFILAYSFMLFNYEGHVSLFTKLLAFFVLGLVGAIYGIVFSVLGYLFKSKILN